MISETDKARIFRFHSRNGFRLKSRESSTVEFKEAFNWGSRDRYSKSIVAFANCKGGFLVFGVKDSPKELVGLQSQNFENLDEAEITQYLNSNFSPEINFEKYTLTIRRRNIGVLEVKESLYKPVIAIGNNGAIKESEIYYRYIARSEKIKHPELISIINSEKEKVEERWRKFFQNMGRIHDIENVSLVDNSTGRPIRVTDDPHAPALRIEEDPTIGGYTLRYRDVTNQMRNEYSSFRANQQFNNLMGTLRENPEFCRTRLLYPDNPNSARAQYFHPRIITELGRHYSD